MILYTAFKILDNPEKYSKDTVREASRVHKILTELVLCPLCKETLITQNLKLQGLSCLACLRWYGQKVHNR
jgi:hypothetical protein